MKRTLTASSGVAIYFIAILINIAIQLVGSIVVTVVNELTGASETLSVLNYILMTAFQIGFLLVFVIGTSKLKQGIAFPVRAVKWYNMLFCLLVSAICVFCFMFPAQWFAILLEGIGYTFSTSFPLSGALDTVLCVIVTVIIAPICEELIFRGALLTGLTKKYGIVSTVIMSGLAFSLMHMNPEQTVYQFCLGCACAYIAICSGSVLCSMLIHAGNNLIAIILEYTGSEFLNVLVSNITVFIVCTIVLLAVGIIAVYYIGRFMLKRERHGAGAGLVFDVKKNIADESTLESADESAQESTNDGIEFASSDTDTATLDIKMPTKDNKFSVATDWIKREAEIDEADISAGQMRVPKFGRRAGIIYYVMGLAVCIAMWLTVFVSNMIGL